MAPMEIRAGAWPTMITPFVEEDGVAAGIDWPAVDALVEWYIAQGVAGIFTVCLSSEMYNLSVDERIQLAKRVVEAAKGRVPVVASGTFPEQPSIKAKAAFVTRMHAEAGVAAVVVIVSQLCGPDDSGEVWQAACQELLDGTVAADGTPVPLGIYECPVPYHRLLTDEDMDWVYRTQRFSFHTDTSCAMKPITSKLKLRPASQRASFKFFNANAATLLDSVLTGADGFSGIAGNLYPAVHKRMIDLALRIRNGEWNKGDTGRDVAMKDAERLQRFLSVAERLVCHKYPASAKRFLSLNHGLKLSALCRTAQYGEWAEEEDIGLRHLQQQIDCDILALIETR